MSQNTTVLRRSLLSFNLPKDVFAALTRNGFETVADLSSISQDDLSRTLNLSLETVQGLLERVQRPPGLPFGPPLSLSASGMVHNAPKISTKCPPLDNILEGGLSQGQILELSGPPGCPKERIVTNILKTFVARGHEAIFVDCQNMSTSDIISELLEPELKQKVQYEIVHDLLDFLVLMHHLPHILASNSRVSLLVINSISFLFQRPNVGVSHRNYHLEKLKQALHKTSSVHNTTIIITSQLSTKMVNADGSPGTFDSGGKGVMLPSLGPSYLPSAKSYRVIVAPNGMYSGDMKLLSSPKYSTRTITSALPTVSYSIETV